MVEYSQSDPHDFITLRIQIDFQQEELKQTPCYRMPIRGEKYTFMCYQPNNSKNQHNPYQYMLQFNEETEMLRQN